MADETVRSKMKWFQRRKESKTARRKAPTLEGEETPFFRSKWGKACKALIVLLVGAILAVPAVFINNVIGYLPLLTYVLLLLVSFVYLRILLRSLTFEEMSSFKDCVRGTNVDFIVRFKNRGPLLFLRLEPYFYLTDLFGNVDTLTKESISLTPFGKYDFRFSVNFEHIGSYGAGLKKVVIYDLLGLFYYTLDNDEKYTVEVSPRIYAIDSLDVPMRRLTETNDATTPIPLDGFDYSGVREYVPGDPMKSIHWKLSARSDTYYTKLYETYGNPGLEIIIDFHAPDYAPEDMMSIFDTVVESAFSLAHYAGTQGIDASLTFQDRTAKRVKYSPKDLREEPQRIISVMPRISHEEFEGVALDIMRNEAASLYSQSNIIVCTASIDKELARGLVAIKNRRKNPLLLAALPPSLDKEERRSLLRPLGALDDYGISYVALSAAKELQEGSE